MSNNFADSVIKALANKGAGKSCSSCGHYEQSVMGESLQTPTSCTNGSIMQSVAIICRNCGYVDQYLTSYLFLQNL